MNYAEFLDGFAWEGGILLVSNEAAIRRIRRKNLSASVANDMRKCPASVAIKSVVPRVEDPFSPAELGTGSHAVLEGLYQLPPLERVREFITEEARRVGEKQWDPAKLAAQTPEALQANAVLREEWTDIVGRNAARIFDMEDPTRVNVVATEMDLRDVIIGKNVPARGFLDRVTHPDEADDADALCLEDYKFGKWKQFNPRFDDDYGDQQRMYAEMLRLVRGQFPKTARLLYPISGNVRVIDLSAAAMRKTINHLETQWEDLNRFSDEGRFPAKPGALCGWCVAANSCPVAKVVTDKAKAQAATQPSRVELGIPVVPRLAPPLPVAEPVPHLVEALRIEGAEALTHTEQEATMTQNAPLQYPTSEYSAMSAFSITDMAVNHLDEHGQPLTQTTMAAFAHVLAGILTRSERNLFGSVGWEHGKHARLGFALASSIKLRPAPFGQSAEEWAAWITRVEGMLTVKTQIALGLLHTDDDFAVDAYMPLIAAVPAA